MSESQSRYSIVERLTEKKLAIMDEMANMDSKAEKLNLESVNEEQLKIQELEELDNQKKDRAKYYDRRIKCLKQEATIFTKGKAIKIESLNKKLKEIDHALEALQTISESASQEAKS